jgi:integrase
MKQEAFFQRRPWTQEIRWPSRGRNIRNSPLPSIRALLTHGVTSLRDRVLAGRASGRSCADVKRGGGGSAQQSHDPRQTRVSFAFARQNVRGDAVLFGLAVQKPPERTSTGGLKLPPRSRTQQPVILLSCLVARWLRGLTGARKCEIVKLKWSDFDLDRACIFLKDSKTGAKSIYLSAPALTILRKLPRLDSSPYVIVGQKREDHLKAIGDIWQEIRLAAGLAAVRLHDLRHSFASVAAASSLGLPIIGKLLGHTQAATTQQYAHLSADPVRAANEQIALKIALAMSAGTNIIPLRKTP